MAVIRLLIFICMLGISRTEKVDSTLEVGVSGAEAVRSVLNKLEHKHFFNLPSGLTDSSQVTEQFMREMAYVASQDGERPSSNDVKGGIWRVDETIFKATQSYNYSSVYQRVCEAFCIDWATVSYKDLSKPFYSGLAVAIYMYHLETVGNGLPVEALDRTKAVFWLTFFQSNQHLSVSIWFLYVAQLRRIEVCKINTDVVFVLDSSGSIGSSNFQLVRDYTYNFTRYLLNGNDDNRVGVVLFGNSAQVKVGLDFVPNNGTQSLLREIRSMPYLNQATNTPEGLCLLKTMNWRDTISTLRLAVVMTDGRSNQKSQLCRNGTGNVAAVSREVHERSPQIVVTAIGVGSSYVLSELQLIATSNETIDRIRSFNSSLLKQNQYYRSYATCFKSSQEVPISQETDGVADEGSISRLKFTSSHDEGISIKICLQVGRVVIYGSYSVPNPGPALYDFKEELSAGTSQCLTTHATRNSSLEKDDCNLCGAHRSRRGKRLAESDQVIVYVTIEGTANSSRYTVNSDTGKSFIDELSGRCRGDSSLCDSDATVACYKNGSVIEQCECVYVDNLILPPCGSKTTAPSHSQKNTNEGLYAVIVLALIMLVACTCFTSLSLICIGCTLRCYFKNHKKPYEALVEVSDNEEELMVEPFTEVDEEADFDGFIPEESF